MPVKGNRPALRKVEACIPQVIQRLESGESLNAIVTDLGLTRNVAAEVVHSVRPGLIQPPRKRHIDREVKRKAVAEYMNGTETYTAVGERYGVSFQTVRRWVYASLGVNL